jgi:hypothetical protein
VTPATQRYAAGVESISDAKPYGIVNALLSLHNVLPREQLDIVLCPVHDAEGLKKLKEILSKYEEILKLL